MSRRILLLIGALVVVLMGVLWLGRNGDDTAEPPATEQVAEATPSTSSGDGEVVDPTESAENPTPTTEADTDPEPTSIPLDTGGEGAVDWEPQIVFSSPQAGETTTLDGAITVRFDQPMDQASVEEAFVVASDAGAASGAFMWTRPDTVIFTPEVALTRAQTYTVEIANTARGINGKQLSDPAKLKFETVGYLAVSNIIPAPDSDSVTTDSAITIFFNRPVVPLVSTGQQADLPQPLTIEPTISGTGEWVSTSIYRFTPDTPLDGATTYQVTVADGLTDVTGGLLEEAETVTFTTVAPTVVGFTPHIDERPIDPNQTITVTFNMPMDRVSTEAAISLSPDGALDFKWSADNRMVGITPANQLALATRYTARIGQEATAANGNATLDAPSELVFNTYPFPQVANTSPREGETMNEFSVPYGGVNIWFASPMDFDTIIDRIEIDPAPESVTYSDGLDNVFLRFGMEYETAYTITVPGDVEDVFGNQMGEPFVLMFDTPPAPALASFNFPTQVAQLSTSFPSDVALLYRNINSAQIALSQFVAELPLSALMEGGFYGDTPQLAVNAVRDWSLAYEPDGEIHSETLSLADGGALPTGVYTLDVSSPDIDRDNFFSGNQSSLLVVADVNLVIKETPETIHVWATDLATGQPVAGVNLAFYFSDRDRGSSAPIAVGDATTDADGFAALAKDYGQPSWGFNPVVVVAGVAGQAGFGVASTSWNNTVQPWAFGINSIQAPDLEESVYLYTDRPLYRPGDTVHVRGWVRSNDYGRYGAPVTEKIELRGYSFFGGDDPIELSFDVDAAGGFYGEFVLADDAPLGTLQLEVTSDSFSGQPFRQITVAEFRKPEILVEVVPEREAILRGETVDVTVSAEFFFGGPAPDMNVSWNLFTTPYRLPWDGPFYNFQETLYEPFPFFGGEEFFGEFAASGEGMTVADGNFVVTIPADVLEQFEEGSRTLTLEATVTDVSGTAVSGNAQVVAHSAETYVGITPSDYAVPVDNEIEMEVITVDWDGAPVANAPVEVVFARREWQSRRDEEGFGVGVIWEPVDTEVARVNVTTDQEGNAVAAFTPTDGGSYVATATVIDSGGRTQTSNAFFYAFDSVTPWRFDARDRKMTLVADQNEYDVGDTAEVLIQSPFAGSIEAWLTIERGEVIEQRLITLNGTSEVIEVPISAEHAPNIFVGVTAIKPVDDSDWPYADVRFGITELVVNPDQLALNVAITTESDRYQPQDTVIYDISVTDFAGNGVAADLSLALVDLALLTLKEDSTPPLIDVFYARQPLRSQIGSGLFMSGEGLAVEAPNQFAGGRGGGGGGEVADEAAFDLARSDESGGDGDEIRSDFRDTAFWEARVTTDANGNAQVSVTLPDNLTTWRLLTKAVSSNTLVGETINDIIATKLLLVRPVTPRFFVVGDTVQIGAIVHNNSAESIAATITLETDPALAFQTGLDSQSLQTINVAIAPEGSELVQWQLTIPDVDGLDFTFRASATTQNGDELTDATKPTVQLTDGRIPVYRFNAEDIVATSGVLDAETRRVEAVLLPPLVDNSLGSVDVQLAPSLAAGVLDTLDVHREPPYDVRCPYSIANRLFPNAATVYAIDQLGLNRPELRAELDSAITAQIAELAERQLGDGGWGWCYRDESDEQVTTYAMVALTYAERAGYPVSELRNNATALIWRQVDGDVGDSREANRQAFYLYALALAGEDVTKEADTLVANGRDLLDPYAKAFLVRAYLAIGGSPTVQTLLNDLSNSVVLSATGAHWQDAKSDYFNWNSDVRGTAIVIDALAFAEPDSPIAANAVRWLMTARSGRVWARAYDTAWSLVALTDYMLEVGEGSADYNYQLHINEALEADDTFTATDLTETEQVSIPIADLDTENVNFFDFSKEGDGRLYYTAHLDAFISADSVEAVDRGFYIERHYYDATCDPATDKCEPLTTMPVGQEVRVELTIVAENNWRYVTIEDWLPSGADAINPNLDTSRSGATAGREQPNYRYGYWGWWFFDQIQFRDEKVVFSAEFLPAGTYQYTYHLQTIVPGEYQVMPTIAKLEFRSEIFGRSNGSIFTITDSP